MFLQTSVPHFAITHSDRDCTGGLFVDMLILSLHTVAPPWDVFLLTTQTTFPLLQNPCSLNLLLCFSAWANGPGKPLIPNSSLGFQGVSAPFPLISASKGKHRSLDSGIKAVSRVCDRSNWMCNTEDTSWWMDRSGTQMAYPALCRFSIEPAQNRIFHINSSSSGFSWNPWQCLTYALTKARRRNPVAGSLFWICCIALSSDLVIYPSPWAQAWVAFTQLNKCTCSLKHIQVLPDFLAKGKQSLLRERK